MASEYAIVDDASWWLTINDGEWLLAITVHDEWQSGFDHAATAKTSIGLFELPCVNLFRIFFKYTRRALERHPLILRHISLQVAHENYATRWVWMRWNVEMGKDDPMREDITWGWDWDQMKISISIDISTNHHPPSDKMKICRDQMEMVMVFWRSPANPTILARFVGNHCWPLSIMIIVSQLSLTMVKRQSLITHYSPSTDLR